MTRPLTTAEVSVSSCQRCGRAALSRDGNPDARMMRHARKGCCVDCAAVIFLQQLENMAGGKLLPPGHTWAEALRLPHVQEQFAALMTAGNADASPDEIDWERVIELWDIASREKGMLW